MAYNANIPMPTDQLSQSQADLLGNFQALSTLINVNHVDFASADQGKHKWVTFPVQAGSPPIAFGAGEVALYSFLNPITSQNELYVNKTNQATVTQIPGTASILSVTSNPGNNVSGWTYLPSGILLKWGNSTATGSTVINFPVAATIPVFTNVMSVLVTPFAAGGADSNIAVRISSFTNTTMTVYGSPRITSGAAAAGFQYLAIGY